MNKEDYLKHVSKEILDLVETCEKNNKRITKNDLPERLNSYEWKLCLPFSSDEYLIENAKYFIKHSMSEFEKTGKYILESTYNDTLKHKIIHLLIDRLEEKIQSGKHKEFVLKQKQKHGVLW